MTLNINRFAQLCQLGDSFILDHFHRRVAATPEPLPEPPQRSELLSRFGLWADEKGGELTPVEMGVVFNYVEAALGLARDKRRRMKVWRDEQRRLHYLPPPWNDKPEVPPPLEEMLTESREEELARHGAPTFFDEEDY